MYMHSLYLMTLKKYASLHFADVKCGYLGLNHSEFSGLLSSLGEQIGADLQHSGRLVMDSISLNMHHPRLLLDVVF